MADLEIMNQALREKVGQLRARLKKSPEDRTLYQELSDLLFQAGKISAAINILEKTLTPTLGGGEAQVEGKRLFDRALEFADAYLFEDAVDCFSQAIENGLDTFEIHYCLSGVHKSLDQIQEAELHCRRCITLNPRFAPAYILLGSLLKRPESLEESVAACKKAVLIDPECTAAYYDLACYYSLLSRREQALAAIEMALCKGFTDFDWLLRDPDLDGLRLNPEFDLLMQSYRQKNS